MAVALGCAIQASLNHGSTLKEYDTEYEVFRQRFRQFQYQEAAGPREAFNNLWELCCQWLKPTMHSKEEILELLVLEQFLTILPSEIETWVRLYRPENKERILALIEDLQRELEIPEQQVGGQEMLLEELAPVGTTHIPPDIQLESPDIQLESPDIQLELPELHVLGPSQEATVTEEWIPQAGPQNPTDGDVRECQPFSEPEYPIPNPDLSFPLEHREDPRVKELQDSKETKQLLYSKIDFEIGRENEEYSSQQKTMENTYAFVFTFEGNIFRGPNLQQVCGQLENQWGNPPKELQLSKLLDYQKHPPGEKSESNNMEESFSLGPHQQENAGKKLHPCSKCGKCFAQRSQLNGHQKIHSGEQPHKCPECGKSFLHSSDFYRHQRFHTGERPYECTICKKRFTRRSHLTGHQRTHSEEKIFKCLQCGKSFCYGASLTRHLKTHTGEKPHRCGTCGKGFIQQSALTLHQRTHTGERPFKCNYCEKSFKHKPTLVIHLRIHTGEKPYECSYCSKTFRQRSGLIMHQAFHFRQEFFKKC
ncbi:zinc finger protein 449-like [Trichechus manatus latirostris]|uniref:Zinc finger protein 449-like n=1 Tax=Trichechus manatus latirostris TaxID=127582 RepID=A0A2Y9FYD0_TRIMA|nr:zinc finger protein 449-like [Trichechus manatus latirostris]